MSAEPASRLDEAIAELKSLILAHYPDATFEVGLGEDPDGTYMIVTVDVEDTDEVVDVIIERNLHMQVEEGIPLYVIVVRPIERTIAELRARAPTGKRPLSTLG